MQCNCSSNTTTKPAEQKPSHPNGANHLAFLVVNINLLKMVTSSHLGCSKNTPTKYYYWNFNIINNIIGCVKTQSNTIVLVLYQQAVILVFPPNNICYTVGKFQYNVRKGVRKVSGMECREK